MSSNANPEDETIEQPMEPEDQIEGSQDIPLPYQLDENGKPAPLDGVESIFLTSKLLRTVHILGL